MSAASIPTPNGLRGRVRPGQTWRRHDVAALRIARLSHDVAVERDRHPEDGTVAQLLDSAAAILDDAATAANPD